MNNDLVKYSRAGDLFHYRWAARRCLKMIAPNSPLKCVVIEGSKDRELSGEYVIDVAEYYESINENEISYYQLKHTTVRKDQPITLSDLKVTIEGFAKRYKEHNNGKGFPLVKVHFCVITNRPFANKLKEKLVAVKNKNKVDTRFTNTLIKYTGLKNEELSLFCNLLSLIDGEGDFDDQEYQLGKEISQLRAVSLDNPIDKIVSLVQKKACQDNGKIIREEILLRLGVTSERDLYPAPALFEPLKNTIVRYQHEEFLNAILEATTPIIIHAAGGVGKSVFARQIIDTLPKGSYGIIYDCFGAGQYRNRSTTRHRYRDALVQIINEMASEGLCDLLIAPSTTSEDQILRLFLQRLHEVICIIKKEVEDAKLIILIDAADNAEIAANDFSQPCFIHELLREQLPDGCKLITLCRTERISLLKPSSTIPKLELKQFSEDESLAHLRNYFPEATKVQGLEFHRLTNNGNPRVQANVLEQGGASIAEVLARLGPLGTTIEKQIGAQLDRAILNIKEKYPDDYQKSIDAICCGLATMPPLIPIETLAAIAKVDKSTVKSFIADLGHPLWLSDTSVQFRDEPTETWFRQQFSSSKEQIADYIESLKPLSTVYTYVSKTLPSLLLKAEQYEELIELAISDDFLPENNEIDKRDVRVYRLQFAFRAALKLKRYSDAAMIAMRAGEEVAGDRRQIELLKNNIDLVGLLQNKGKVQELAFSRMLCSNWDGSENVFSGALLSAVEDFKIEAGVYLKAAQNWLLLFFKERKNGNNKQYDLKDEDIVEMAYTYYSLYGLSEAVNFILSWQPPIFVHRIALKFFKRIIDIGDNNVINELTMIDSLNQYLIIALSRELMEIGRYPSKKSLEQCLVLFCTKKSRIPKPNYIYDEDSPFHSIISFAEACLARGLSKTYILRMLRYYFPTRASRSIYGNYFNKERAIFLRAIALRSIITNVEPDLNELLPKALVSESNYSVQQEKEQFKEMIEGLLPWFIVRGHALSGQKNICDRSMKAEQKSKGDKFNWRESNIVLYEISQICVDILILSIHEDREDILKFYNNYLKEKNEIRIQDRLRIVRASCRLDRLSMIMREVELSARNIIDSLDDGPDERADRYISLARAVLYLDYEDAAAYFNIAIEAVSKFGDEIISRWNATEMLADYCADGGCVNNKLAYRFIRCAELVGENVYREDNFNRNSAIRTCTKLSPNIALAAFSRWTDRNIGHFGEQIHALAHELVESHFIPSSIVWALSTFLEHYDLIDFTKTCIENEASQDRRKCILDNAIHELRLNDTPLDAWERLNSIAQEFYLSNEELDSIIIYLGKSEKENKKLSYGKSSYNEIEINWNEMFAGLDLSLSNGIYEAIKRYDITPPQFKSRSLFWKKVILQIDNHNACIFLHSILNSEITSYQDVLDVLSFIPQDWLNKISVKKKLPDLFKCIGRRFPFELINHHYLLNYFIEKTSNQRDAKKFIYEGIIEGLSTSSDFSNAETFFGFIKIAKDKLNSSEAKKLLAYSLSRFELHMKCDFGDGCWSESLEPPKDLAEAFTGMLWSFLGCPDTKIRWQAAHCIRRLSEYNCLLEIDKLINWMKRDKIYAFGCDKYIFYNLHARLYLLIALARVSIHNSTILFKHADNFKKIAIDDMPHILIQKLASKIALNIENTYPGTYNSETINQLNEIGISKFPYIEENRREQRDSYWHNRGEVDTSLKFYHGYDFDSYWFNPLGRIFGVSGKQVAELSNEVIIKKWNIIYDSDPRSELWKSYKKSLATYYHQGSYPTIDDFRFYLSYHAMFVVAAKLINKMPIVRYYEEDEWTSWLKRHYLTISSGLWLADHRGPVPISKPNWVRELQTEDWCSEITEDDFLRGLIEEDEELWLNIAGFWVDGDSQHKESFYIASALVSPETSESLLNALTTCANPMDFKLPEYGEDEEHVINPFELKGWIAKDSSTVGIDELDPHSARISYPPYHVGDLYMDRLGIKMDSSQREYCMESKPSLKCEIWSTNDYREDDIFDPLRSGNRIKASLDFLKKLCSVLKKELIIEVQIERKKRKEYYSREEGNNEYTPPRNKIYILSADGRLRDTEKYYELR